MRSWLKPPYPPPHPDEQTAWIAKRQKELEAQYVREETFKLTPLEEKLLARGKLNARKKAKVDFLQSKYDDVSRHTKA
jgi:hypothetical protein